MISSTDLKIKAQEFLKPVAQNLGSLGVSPNAITVLGFLLSLASGIMVGMGSVFTGALLFGLSGLCDTLDGITARVLNRKSRFGAFLDSFLDRYSDFFPLAGVCHLAHLNGDSLLLLGALLTIAGSFSTSYARARAEALGVDCKEGLLERPERFFILLFGLLFNYLFISIAVLALLTNFTALQRLICAARKLS
ncbi:CDP-alcohol phosphatidyltransferase family protein [Thermovibrio sp.]